MPHDLLQQPFLPQAEGGVLIVVDGVDGDGRLGEPIGEGLFPRRESLEALGLQLNESGGESTAPSSVGPFVNSVADVGSYPAHGGITILTQAPSLYHGANFSYGDATPDKRLSWQTEILPYLEQKPLYDRIDFKKSWDDAANHAAVSTPLVVFINPMIGEQNAGGLPVTEYVGLAGVGEDGPMLPVTSPKAGVFAYNRVTRIQDIVDGTSNTIMTSECNKDFGSWAAGGRPTIRALTKKPYIDGPDGLGGQPEGVQVGFADGSVRFVSKSVDPQLLERLVTIAGHEQINIPGQ